MDFKVGDIVKLGAGFGFPPVRAEVTGHFRNSGYPLQVLEDGERYKSGERLAAHPSCMSLDGPQDPGIVELPTEHFLQVNVNQDGGESLSISIPLIVNERGYPEIVGQQFLEREKGQSGLFTRIRLEMRSPEHCIGCGAILSKAPAELQFEVRVRTLVEGIEQLQSEEVKACHNCVRKALREPEEGLAGMPIFFEAQKAVLPDSLAHTYNCFDSECKIEGEHLRSPECGP